MTTQLNPRVLFFGGGGGAGAARLLQVDSGSLDAGAGYTFEAISNPITAAQPSVELAAFATYLHITATDLDAPHYITPLLMVVSLFVDDLDPIERTITIPPAANTRHWPFEVSWHRAITSAAGIEQATVAPRGFRMRIGVRSTGAIPPGRVIIDGVETQMEVLGETLTSLAR